MSVMHQNDRTIVRKSNIRSEAIIINQADKFEKEEFIHNGELIHLFTFDEKGVGLSRNNALMRADADIVLFADDDIRYMDNYKDLVIGAFNDNPDADIIMFNLSSTNPDRPSGDNLKKKRIRRYNSLKYGTYRMAARLDSLRSKNLYFSLLFGGGAKYLSGEDSLFIYDAISSGLKIVALPVEIGVVSHGASTWFDGYTERFFHDKGALFYHLSPTFAYFLIGQFILRKHKQFNVKQTRVQVFKLMIAGVESARKVSKV